MDVFAVMRESTKGPGWFREAETFVDVGKLESKMNAWKERDRAIAAGSRAPIHPSGFVEPKIHSYHENR